MKLKRMTSQEVPIGEEVFHVRPLAAMDSAQVFGDVTSVILPIAGVVAISSGDEEERKSSVELDKSCGVMSEQTGRKIVDYILDMYAQDDPKALINHQTKSLVLSFIGGEPLLEAQLIERIGDYYFEQCFRRDIPLAPYTRISFATNGQLWFTEEAQHLIRKYHEFLSVTVSIDGVKELHDAFRVDAEGNGSFDKAYVRRHKSTLYRVWKADSVDYLECYESEIPWNDISGKLHLYFWLFAG